MTEFKPCDPKMSRNPAPMRCKVGRGVAVLVAVCVAVGAEVVLASSFAPHRPTLQPGVPLIVTADAAPASGPATAVRAAVAPIGGSGPLFFGFVEFDWDPDAPGGVPGFGPLPAPARIGHR